MIAAWMLGAVVAGALVTLAAVAAERALRVWRRPARVVWAVALGVTLAAPAAVLVAPRAPRAPRASGDPWVVRATSGVVRLPVITVRARDAARGLGAWLAPLDALLVAAWALGSALALARLARGARWLGRARRGWRPARVDGVDVLVAPAAGPLVVGVRAPRVVLPQWALALDAARLALVVRHEREHARARDPALLLLAGVAVALAPWNVALWWQARRLRLAVEVDCDARVLGAHPDVAGYGLLLIDVARHAAAPNVPLAAALLESTTDLERRITAMRPRHPRHRVLTSAAFTALAAAATLAAFVACRVSEVASPGRARPGASETNTAAQPGLSTIVVTALRPEEGRYFEFTIDSMARPVPGSVGPLYPEALKAAGVEGSVVAQFVVDDSGRADPRTLKVLRASGPEFVAAVRDWLPTARFVPARVGTRTVRQLMQQPFVFSLADAAQSGARATLRPGFMPGPAQPRPRVVEGAYYEYQVEQPVVPAPGNRGPRYPDTMKAADVEGEVLAQYVVDTAGRVEPETFRVLKSSHRLFTEAVQASLATARYVPAKVGGRPVRQVVQQPFQFALSK